jgi:hypothetical protein
MLDNKDWGRVVFVSSEVRRLHSEGEMVHYGFSKPGATSVIARGAAETTKAHQRDSQFGDARSDLGRDGAGPSAARAEAAGTTVDDLVQRTFTNAARRRCCSATPCRKRRQPDLLRLLQSLQRTTRAALRATAGLLRTRFEKVSALILRSRGSGVSRMNGTSRGMVRDAASRLLP